MWRTIVLYGAALAVGAVALQWLEYQWIARSHATALYVGLIAAAFLALGVWLGWRFARPAPAAAFETNVQAQASLGISAREVEVLLLLAAGRSNKEMASALAVSPNTVKTHLANLYGKLGAARRTEAVRRGRELGLIP